MWSLEENFKGDPRIKPSRAECLAALAKVPVLGGQLGILTLQQIPIRCRGLLEISPQFLLSLLKTIILERGKGSVSCSYVCLASENEKERKSCVLTCKSVLSSCSPSPKVLTRILSTFPPSINIALGHNLEGREEKSPSWFCRTSRIFLPSGREFFLGRQFHSWAW